MADQRLAVEAIWRIESRRLVAHLVRLVRDIGLAEDLAQDALVAALETWPSTGVPVQPGAWLMRVAKNRAIDRLRRNQSLTKKLEAIGREQGDQLSSLNPDFSEGLDRDINDEMLGLIFTACHPLLSLDSRVALTLKVVGGLSVAEIARAFLVQESAIAQRILRAKRTLAAARIPPETPTGPELPSRLEAVLQVIYLVFNEGYSATSGSTWIRPALAEEAMRLGRVLAALMPLSSEVLSFAALMELQASRFPARVGPHGEPVLLKDQDRSRWDQLLLRRGFATLEIARRHATAGLGPYGIQAEIAACHARALEASQTDWSRICALYDALAQLQPTAVVALNRAVAVSMAYGPAEALEIVEELVRSKALNGYHPLPAVKGDLLFRLGRWEEAAKEFEAAATLTANQTEKDLLHRRALDCGTRSRLPADQLRTVALKPGVTEGGRGRV